jgi:hypothetical protein
MPENHSVLSCPQHKKNGEKQTSFIPFTIETTGLENKKRGQWIYPVG